MAPSRIPPIERGNNKSRGITSPMRASAFPTFLHHQAAGKGLAYSGKTQGKTTLETVRAGNKVNAPLLGRHASTG